MIIGRVCRRLRLRGAQAEDFASVVKLALIDGDYALLRAAFRCASPLAFLAVVIQRLALDEQTRLFGRWQSSAAARRMGDAGVLAETLLLRDRRSVDEALPHLRALDPSITRKGLEEIAAALPARSRRPRAVGLGARGVDNLMATESADDAAVTYEVNRLADRASHAVRDALEAMPVADRILIRSHFGSSMSIAEISRTLHVPQRPLYRRLQMILARLGNVLRLAGIDGAAVSDLIGSPLAEMQFDLGRRTNR
jgi:DNA-directed RNA polymerase specialized sigma24 family protein